MSQPMVKFDIGDLVRIEVDVVNLDGNPADPTTVVLTVRRPDQTVTTISTLNTAVGTYQGDVTIDQSGEWNYRWACTGAVVLADEGAFYVRTRKV